MLSHIHPVIVSLQANIGAGKTSLISRIKRYQERTSLPIFACEEPVRQWAPMLERFERGECFGGDLQTYIQGTLFQRQLLFPNRGLIVEERSFESVREIFIPLLLEDGHLSSPEVLILMHKQRPPLVQTEHMIVYIHTPAEVCFQCVKSRKQPGDAKVTMRYLERIEEKHQEWLEKDSRPILRVDGMQRFDLPHIFQWISNQSATLPFENELADGFARSPPFIV
jgi:deoxyadenosine/deoxycytidine kinase